MPCLDKSYLSLIKFYFYCYFKKKYPILKGYPGLLSKFHYLYYVKFLVLQNNGVIFQIYYSKKFIVRKLLVKVQIIIKIKQKRLKVSTIPLQANANT